MCKKFNKKFGIDISAHQGEFPLDVAVSEGVQFVIIKAGGGDAGLYKDKKFERNYAFAKQLGLPVGCYFYSKALSESDAYNEASFLYNNCLAGKNFELPVYYDVEDAYQMSLGKDKVTRIIQTFCNFINSKKYVVGIYASLSNFNNSFYDDQLNEYDKWVAQWSSNLAYKKECGMWQFGGEVNYIRSNKIAGQVVDQDFMLKDYSNQKVDSIEPSMTVDDAIKLVVSIALEEVGYHEKASNYMLDDKTANTGSANYTKYARDLDAISWFYNGPKQGFAYCDVFVDWVMVKAFGAETAIKVLYQPKYSAGAGCTYSMQYYQQNGAFYSSPKVGDQIFFGNSYESTHTGIVIKIDGSNVITVEGNTSDGVYQRSYTIGSSNILGYGRPNYAIACNGSSGGDDIPVRNICSIKDVQIYLNQKYLSVFKNELDVDGEYGDKTRSALVMALQGLLGTPITGTFNAQDKRKFPILKNGAFNEVVCLVQCELICHTLSVGPDGADGVYGNNTINAVKQFQWAYFLEVDGECGPNTAEKLFS